MSNPYVSVLEEAVEGILARDPEEMMREGNKIDVRNMDEDNEWIYRTMAQNLLTAAWNYARKGSRWERSPEVLGYLEKLFPFLVQAARDDRWYHQQVGKGDPNIDRFTLLPFMEAYILVRDDLSEDVSHAVIEKIRGVLAVQYCEFGQATMNYSLEGGTREDAPYPNMDVYYCLIMELGHRLTGDDAYHTEFKRFIGILERAQFEDGGWTYINGTNECPTYHNLVVAVMGRIWQLTQNKRALRMIERSIPYYPLIVAPNGVSEYITDPWWKHTWNPMGPAWPDIVASLTGDGQNRWVGNQARDRAESNLYSVYAADLWNDVKEIAVPMENSIVYDKNTEGPRGRFAEWSWAATARYGSDTLVGAIAHTGDADNITGLLGISPEVEHRHEGNPDCGMIRFALGMTPPGTRGITDIHDGHCTFEARYPMASFRSVWGMEAFPSAWECRQRWRLDARSMSGRIEIVSLKSQESPPPLVRIRWGRHLEIKELDRKNYVYGPFQMKIHHNDFPEHAIKPTTACTFRTDDDAWVQTLSLGSSPRHYDRDATYAVELEITFAG